MLLLGVETAQQVCVPWTLCLLEGGVRLVFLRLTRVGEVVRVVEQRPADDEGSLPRGGLLVPALGVLDQPEHEVTLRNKRGWIRLA